MTNEQKAEANAIRGDVEEALTIYPKATWVETMKKRIAKAAGEHGHSRLLGCNPALCVTANGMSVFRCKARSLDLWYFDMLTSSLNLVHLGA